MRTIERYRPDHIVIPKVARAQPALPDGRSWWMQFQTGWGMTKKAEELFARVDGVPKSETWGSTASADMDSPND
jgi:hypothetical protein